MTFALESRQDVAAAPSIFFPSNILPSSLYVYSVCICIRILLIRLLRRKRDIYGVYMRKIYI